MAKAPCHLPAEAGLDGPPRQQAALSQTLTTDAMHDDAQDALTGALLVHIPQTTQR